jgi:hypothetical protein
VIVACFCVAMTTTVRAEQIDRVVAIVGDRVISASDVALEESLVSRLPCPESVLCDERLPAIDRLIHFAVLRALAGDAQAYAPTNNDVDRALGQLRRSWADVREYEAFLERWGLAERDIAGLIYSRLVCHRYLRRNLTLSLRDEDADAVAYAQRYALWIESRKSVVQVRTLEPIGQAP